MRETRAIGQVLRRRQRWLLAAFTLLCVLFILLPSLPGSFLALPPALRFPFVVVGLLLLPGYLLDELLHVSGPRLNLTSPPLWFALSLGALAPAGWAVLGLHTNLRVFGLLAGGLIVLLCAIVLLARGSLRGGEWEFRRRDRWLWLAALVLLLITLALIVFWAPPGSTDYWIYRAYLREYVDSAHINLWDPFLGEGAPITPRLRYEVWLAVEAFVGLASGFEPAFVLPELLDPLFAILAMLATYTLARELLGTARRALAATSLQMMAYLYSPHILQPGHYLLIRTSEDKTIAFFTLLPLAWALVLRSVTRRDRAAWWGALLVALGLVSVHGMSYALLVFSCGLFFVFAWLLRLPREQKIRLLGITLSMLPLVVFVVMTVFNTTQLGPAPGGVGWTEFMAARLAVERIIHLGGTSLFIVNPELVLFPLSIAGLLATPLILLRRRDAAAALLVGNQVGPLFVLFIPGIPNLIARFLDFKVIYRMIWVALPALAVAVLLAQYWSAIQRLAQRVLMQVQGLARPLQVALAALASAALLGLGASLVLSVFAYQGSDAAWPDPALRAVLNTTAPAVSEMGAPLVLAPKLETFHIPAVWGLARTLITRGELLGTQEHLPPERQQEALDRAALVNSVVTATASDAGFVEQLQTLGVDLIVLNRQQTPAVVASLDRFPLSYMKVFETGEHTIYLVNLSSPTSLAAVGRGQLALARGERGAACAEFDAAATQFPVSPLAQAGLGLCADLAGESERARRAYADASLQLGAASWQPDWPAALGPWLAWNPRLADELGQTLRAASQQFVQERLYRAEHPDSGGDAVQESWLNGWPFSALVQPIGTSISLEMPSTGRPAQVSALARNAGAENVVVGILAETLTGIEMDRPRRLGPGQSTLIEMSLPADAAGRLWLSAQPGDEVPLAGAGSVVWSQWTPYVAEDARPPAAWSADAARLVDWLDVQYNEVTGEPADVRFVMRHARVLLGEAEQSEGAALRAENLLDNATFEEGPTAGWNIVPAGAKLTAERERRQEPEVVWAARMRNITQEYQGGVCQTVAVQAGQAYVYVFRVSADLGPGASVRLGYWDYRRLRIEHADMEKVLSESATSWTPVWRLVHVPNGVHNMSVCPALISGPATVRISQVWFIPLEALK